MGILAKCGNYFPMHVYGMMSCHFSLHISNGLIFQNTSSFQINNFTMGFIEISFQNSLDILEEILFKK